MKAPRPRRGLAMVIGFGLCYGFWVLLVQIFQVAELLAGVAAAALGVLGGARSMQGEQHLGAGLQAEGRRLWRLPFLMVGDSIVVLGAALRAAFGRGGVRGAFREIPHPGGGDDPDAAGRRAVTIAVESFAPNTCVLGFDTARGVIVVHQLVPTPHTRPRRRARP